MSGAGRPRHTEDELRAALPMLERHAPSAEAVLRAVRDSGGRHAPGLARLRQSRPGQSLPSAHRLRWARPAWLIPLAAAAAVAVVVTVPVVIFRGQAPAAVTPGTPGGTASGLGGAPPFYLAAPQNGKYAVIASTATGKAVVLIKPPRGTRSVSPAGAAADDRTFVLGASKFTGGVATEFFRVRFHPGTAAAAITQLPVHLSFGGKPAPHDTVIFEALSPDAAKLAVVKFELGTRRSMLAVTTYALATGSSRTWTRKVPGLSPELTSAVWSASGRQLQVVWQDSLSGRLFTDQLNTAAPGTRLPQPAKRPLPANVERLLESIYVAPDDGVLLAYGAYHPTWTLAELSPRTGQLTHVLGPVRHTKITPVVQWAGNTGHVLIISGKDGGLGVLHNGRYLPLPLGILRNPLASAIW